MVSHSRLLGLFLMLLLPFTLAAEPVDTNQFGHIKEGMPEAQVMARLGPPDTRQVVRRYSALEVVRGERQATLYEEVLLFYKGDESLMHTYITIDRGVVASKIKRKF